MQYLDSGDLSPAMLKGDKQYQAILKGTTSMVLGGKRVRVQRRKGETLNPSGIRAIRNGQKWASANIDDIRAEMYCEIPWQWIKEEEEEAFELF